MNEKIENFIEKLDQIGLSPELKDLIETLSSTCSDVQSNPNFAYGCGLFEGRKQYEAPGAELPVRLKIKISDENGMLKGTNGLELKKNSLTDMSFEDLSTFISEAESSFLKNSFGLEYAKGLHLGRQIHLEFGGVGGEKYTIGNYDIKRKGFRLVKKETKKNLKIEKYIRKDRRLWEYFKHLRARIKNGQDRKDYYAELRFYYLLKKAYKAYLKRKDQEAFLDELERKLKELESLEEERILYLLMALPNYGFKTAFEQAIYDIIDRLIDELGFRQRQ